MSKGLVYVVSLFLVVIAAAQTAIADPVAVPGRRADPGDPRIPSTIPDDNNYDHNDYDDPSYRSRDVPMASPVRKQVQSPDTTTGRLMTMIFAIPTQNMGGSAKVFCFENPQVKTLQGASGENHKPGWVSSWYLGGVRRFSYRGRGRPIRRPASSAAVSAQIGCFPPGVKITMADGSLRNIEDVRAGDAVRNAKTGAPVEVRQVIEGPEALPLLRFGFEGTTVTTSQAHPVLTAAGLKPANELKKGDTIFDALGNPHPLTILETLPLEEGQRVINVSLDAASPDADERLLVSDGIITGDIVLQGLLKERK